MKRATLLLEDEIYKQAKILSQKKGQSLKRIVNDLLRFALNQNFERQQKKTPFEIPSHTQRKPNRNIDISDRNSLYDLLED